MKKFYRRGDGCGLDGKIYELSDEIYKPKSEVCDLGDEIYEAKYEARELGDEIYGLIGAAHKRICARSRGTKAAGGDV